MSKLPAKKGRKKANVSIKYVVGIARTEMKSKGRVVANNTILGGPGHIFVDDTTIPNEAFSVAWTLLHKKEIKSESHINILLDAWKYLAFVHNETIVRRYTELLCARLRDDVDPLPDYGKLYRVVMDISTEVMHATHMLPPKRVSPFPLLMIMALSYKRATITVCLLGGGAMVSTKGKADYVSGSQTLNLYSPSPWDVVPLAVIAGQIVPELKVDRNQVEMECYHSSGLESYFPFNIFQLSNSYNIVNILLVRDKINDPTFLVAASGLPLEVVQGHLYSRGIIPNTPEGNTYIANPRYFFYRAAFSIAKGKWLRIAVAETVCQEEECDLRPEELVFCGICCAGTMDLMKAVQLSDMEGDFIPAMAATNRKRYATCSLALIVHEMRAVSKQATQELYDGKMIGEQKSKEKKTAVIAPHESQSSEMTAVIAPHESQSSEMTAVIAPHESQSSEMTAVISPHESQSSEAILRVNVSDENAFESKTPPDRRPNVFELAEGGKILDVTSVCSNGNGIYETKLIRTHLFPLPSRRSNLPGAKMSPSPGFLYSFTARSFLKTLLLITDMPMLVFDKTVVSFVNTTYNLSGAEYSETIKALVKEYDIKMNDELD